MASLSRLIFNPYIAVYLLILIGSQGAYYQWRRRQHSRLNKHRRTRGLPPTSLASIYEQPSKHRRRLLFEIVLLLTTLLVVPIVLIAIANQLDDSAPATGTYQNGLTLLVLAAIAIMIISGLQPARAFVGGLAYRVMATFSVPFQIGDYVSINKTHGKVVQFDTFLTKIRTLNGHQLSVPTYTLWRETVTNLTPRKSSSSGSFSPGLSIASFQSPSITQFCHCEIVFYLSPVATSEQLKVIEANLLETVRSSAYIEPSGPIEIHYSQLLEAIKLTVTAYVGAVEHSAAFRSEITRQFLSLAERKQISLAHPSAHLLTLKG